MPSWSLTPTTTASSRRQAHARPVRPQGVLHRRVQLFKHRYTAYISRYSSTKQQTQERKDTPVSKGLCCAQEFTLVN
jgi:hypothetical protein